MKKKLFIGFLALAVFALAATESNAQVSVQNVMKRVTAVVEKLESQKAQVLYLQIDTLEKDQLSTQAYTLEAGSSYAIVTIGDQDRIQDIDMVIADDKAKIVGKDDDEENIAIVKVTPTRSGSFTIGVKGFKMTRNDGFFAIIICRLD